MSLLQEIIESYLDGNLNTCFKTLSDFYYCDTSPPEWHVVTRWHITLVTLVTLSQWLAVAH